MREVAKNIAEIEAGHCELGYDHFKECTEGGEDSEFVLVETETRCSAEVSTLHNTRWNEHFRVLLVNNLQASGSLKIT